MEALVGVAGSIKEVFLATWWLWLFIILWPFFESTWLFWRQELFKDSMEFVLLELRIPREIKKSPMAMEQVLTAINGLRNAPADVREKWWDGEVTRWYSLELTSFGGEVHFYVRTYAQQKPLVEAAFFSYYPDVEIAQVDDYTDRLPVSYRELDENGYDLWGTELVLKREDAYPIKSYLDFESPEEEKQYDPISVFLEVLGKVKKEEIVVIQFLIAPADHNWRDKWSQLIEDMRIKKEKKEAAKPPGYKRGVEFPHILPTFPVTEGKRQEQKLDTTFMKAFSRTPGETDVLKAVEENLSKPAFHTLIRFIYFSPKELFYDSYPRRGLKGAFNQYGSLDLNSFLENYAMSTRTKIWQWPHIFPKARNVRRKERILTSYRKREIPPETWMGRLILSKFYNWDNSRQSILNTRSLASLFHPPTYLVLTAPHIKRVESRKTGPPAGLPIYGEEHEIEKYK